MGIFVPLDLNRILNHVQTICRRFTKKTLVKLQQKRIGYAKRLFYALRYLLAHASRKQKGWLSSYGFREHVYRVLFLSRVSFFSFCPCLGSPKRSSRAHTRASWLKEDHCVTFFTSKIDNIHTLSLLATFRQMILFFFPPRELPHTEKLRSWENVF